jgi:hypothetical protein
MARGSSYNYAQGKDENAEKTVAGNQKRHLPGRQCEGIASTFRGQIRGHRFFLRHAAFALSEAKPVKQH